MKVHFVEEKNKLKKCNLKQVSWQEHLFRIFKFFIILVCISQLTSQQCKVLKMQHCMAQNACINCMCKLAFLLSVHFLKHWNSFIFAWTVFSCSDSINLVCRARKTNLRWKFQITTTLQLNVLNGITLDDENNNFMKLDFNHSGSPYLPV